jgi:ubiquinone/menaquinone biosynthesis C-methylase UbiE
MKEVKDNFSVQSDGYSRFRPVYPLSLYKEILSHVASFQHCWDCATGNGQIASVMADRFEIVNATDISKEQLEKAPNLPRVSFEVCRAEATPFDNDVFDLITVGQAVHWFDFESFNKEVKRVGKNGCVIAVIGYGLMYVDRASDAALMEFYEGTIGKYWDPERKHIDSHYASIPFPFEEMPLSKEFSIDVSWNLAQLEGYLNTWSSVNRYIKQNGKNPVSSFIEQLRTLGIWNDDELKEVHFPLFVKLGRINK